MAIRELVPKTKGIYGRTFETGKLTQELSELFSVTGYGFETIQSCHLFEKKCNQILNAFSRKWHPLSAQRDYETTFALSQWKTLPDALKRKHSLSNCAACYHNYESLQVAFPLKPVYVAPKPILVSLPVEGSSQKEVAQKVLTELNLKWDEHYNSTFTTTLPNLVPELNLVQKPSKEDKKREDRKQKRRIVKHVAKQMGENATMCVLAESESLSAYSRKRLSMSFEKPEMPAKRHKSHSPKEENIEWDVKGAVEFLQQFPEEETINWTRVARQFGGMKGNAGQVLKELAVKHGIDIQKLEHKAPSLPRLRSRKRKLPGGEISIPSMPTTIEITNEKVKLIESGELSIGEPCSPYMLMKSVVSKDGNIMQKQVQIYGRKIPLLDIRERLMEQHEMYMRQTTDAEFNALTKSELLQMATTCHIHLPSDPSDDQLRAQLALTQRTRTLALWHDHSTILQTGYILFAVWVIYDVAVFLTKEEYMEKHGKPINNLQEIVEDPIVYMIAPSSSSPSDQLALIGDRLECLAELPQQIASSSGILFQDELRFFCGDKPAQQFERGTQIGGTYKCGSCGCKDIMMQDLAHALNCKWRCLADLQQLVVAGTYGKTAGCLKPLDGLYVEQLREELQSRGLQTDNKLKPQLQEELTELLSGAQRVPSLLILNPTQSLSSLNLPRYEVLDCEPLHDLKGHLSNLLPEIPHLLPPGLKEQCQQLLTTTIQKQKLSGATVRTAAIKLFLKLLQHEAANPLVVRLVHTAVKISEIFYLSDSKRTPKTILQLYNVTWLHHELCAHLIPSPKEQTRSHLFGIYLHDIAVHAAPQYEIVCLRSTNSESQERLFSQIKGTSLRATNRKVETVLPTVLLSLQAKRKVTAGTAMKKQDTMVSSVAKHVPAYTGTTFDKAFVHKRLHSWQAHLQRICHYLKCGEGVWWSQDTHVYRFHDSDIDPDSYSEGPTLQHFRHRSLPDVYTHNDEVWQELIQSNTNLPTTKIRLYKEDGTCIREKHYPIPNLSPPETMCAPLSDQPSGDGLCAPLSDQPSGSSESLSEPLADPPSSYTCSPPSPSATTVLSKGHTNLNFSLTSTPIASKLSHHTSLKPTSLFTSISTEKLSLCTASSSNESPEPEREEIVSLICDLTQLHQDMSKGTQLHVAQKQTHEFRTKAAMVIGQVIDKHNQALKQFDDLRSSLKIKRAQKQTPTLSEKELYQRLQAQLHTALICAKETLKSELQAFEKEYLKIHGSLPLKNSHYVQLQRSLGLAKKLLLTWNSFDI